MPKNDDSLSILGFGCMRLPIKDDKIDEVKAISQIRYAIDQGINYVDTAWPYHAGESESLVGKALKDGYRDRVKVATKLPSWMIDTREDMDRYLAAQLAKLQTDRIDYYLVHALNGTLWDNLVKLGVLDFLEKAQKDGRIINIGFSFHGPVEDFKRIVDAYPWCFCQIQYNYLDQKNQAGTEGLEYAAAKGLGVIIMDPLRGGKLALPNPPAAIEALWKQAKTPRAPVDWALRWIWNRPEVVVVLSGMNDDAHIQQNLCIASEACANSMTKEELELVDRVAEAYGALMKIGCTNCGYCMPCPSDVMISACFEEYNKMHMFNAVDEGKFVYALGMSGELSGKNPGFASQCVQCGDCLDKCPQGLPIPELLEQVVAEMEGSDLMERVATVRKVFKIKAA